MALVAPDAEIRKHGSGELLHHVIFGQGVAAEYTAESVDLGTRYAVDLTHSKIKGRAQVGVPDLFPAREQQILQSMSDLAMHHSWRLRISASTRARSNTASRNPGRYLLRSTRDATNTSMIPAAPSPSHSAGSRPFPIVA